MSSFLADFTKKIEKATGQAPPWGDVNPLVVIGLTEAILDLGLTEEQLFASTRSYGRQLAAQIHPDRKPTNVSADRQKQILEAFDFLGNFENFRLALKDFKTLRADDRREVKILGQALSALRAQVNDLESQYQTYLVNKSQLEVDMKEFEQAKKEEGLEAPKLRGDIEVLRKDTEEKGRMLAIARTNSMHWKTRFEHAVRYFPSLDSSNSKRNSTGVFTFEARWIAVVGLSHKVGFPTLSPLDQGGNIRDDFRTKALGVGIKETKLIEIVEIWKQALVRFSTKDLEDNTLPLGFALIKLSSGKQNILFGDPLFAQGGRVVGSVSAPIHSNERARLRHGVSQENVLELLSPSLMPGGLMVSIYTMPGRRASWSLTCPAFKFVTKKVILAVG